MSSTSWRVTGHGCAIIRRASVLLLSVVLLFTSTAHAADRTLAAEGDYVALQDRNKPLAHWKLWHLQNGEYEVVETLAGPSHIVQVFHFDAQFLPSGFSLTIDTFPIRSKRRKRTFMVHPTIISCRYNIQDLSCESENNGTKSATTIPAKRPYVFVPGEFYALDRTWFMAGIFRLTEHNDAEAMGVNVYVMLDNKIRAGRPIQLTYSGKQTARLNGKVQPVREFEIWTESEPGAWVLRESSVLQVTSKGIVASIRGKPDPGLGYEIANYKEYEHWPSR
jgi:hypothetical protein